MAEPACDDADADASALVALLPPPPRGSDYDKHAEEHMHAVLPLWRARRSERSGLDVTAADGAPLSVPGRAWGWRAFQREARADGGIGVEADGTLDAAVVYVFVRRALLAVHASDAASRGAGAIAEKPRCKYRVAVSLLDAAGEPFPAPGAEEKGEGALHTDATSAEPAVALTAAARTVEVGDSEALPDLPAHFPGLGVACWHEALAVVSPVVGAAGDAPPLLLRVTVLAEVVGDARGEAYDDGDALAVAVGLAASVDLGLSAPGADAADPLNDPAVHRLRLRFPQPDEATGAPAAPV
jgi:hypothetical protein